MDWRVQLPKRLVHIDIDPTEFGRNYEAEIAVQADAKAALAALLGGLEGVAPDPAYAAEVTRVRNAARGRARAKLGVYEQVMDELRALLPRDAILVRDATIPAYTWGDRLFPIEEPRTSIRSTSAAIGPGLPLALGAKLGRPDRTVAAICGDGGFMLNLSELATAVEHEIAVVVLLFDDGGYGILREYQTSAYAQTHAVDLVQPDFEAVARGFGVAVRSCRADGFADALRWGLEREEPAVVVLREKLVFSEPTA